ncbi:MAG: hypothetical protein AB7Q23_12580 [Hyphomonadaceae bacterium]
MGLIAAVIGIPGAILAVWLFLRTETDIVDVQVSTHSPQDISPIAEAEAYSACVQANLSARSVARQVGRTGPDMYEGCEQPTTPEHLKEFFARAAFTNQGANIESVRVLMALRSAQGAVEVKEKTQRFLAAGDRFLWEDEPISHRASATALCVSYSSGPLGLRNYMVFAGEPEGGPFDFGTQNSIAAGTRLFGADNCEAELREALASN